MSAQRESVCLSAVNAGRAEEIFDIAPCTMAVVHETGHLRTHVGSGIAVYLYDRRQKIAGMDHFLFSRTDDPEKATGRYGNAALIGLHQLLAKHSASMPIVAHIAGGAYSDEFEMDAVLENIRIAWKFLFIKRIPLITQHIGDRSAREVQFNVAAGVFTARQCAPHTRVCIWLPPQNHYSHGAG